MVSGTYFSGLLYGPSRSSAINHKAIQAFVRVSSGRLILDWRSNVLLWAADREAASCPSSVGHKVTGPHGVRAAARLPTDRARPTHTKARRARMRKNNKRTMASPRCNQPCGHPKVC